MLQAVVNKQHNASQRVVNNFRADREREQQQRSLEARLAGPSLASRIARAEATATYMLPMPTTVSRAFNFERLTLDNLLEIVGTKLTATCHRLLILDDISIPDNMN